MRVATASYAATVAGVRAVVAAYAQAIDDGQHRDVAALFCPDGSIDLPSSGVTAGREAVYALLSGGPPPSLARHAVTGTHVTRWSADHAVAISDLIVVGRGDRTPWSFRSVGRYFDLLHRRDDGWRFHSRMLRFADDA
jgi:hypothetical protein